MSAPSWDLSHEPVLDDSVVVRLLQLRDQVARAGENVLGELVQLFETDSADRIVLLRTALRDADHTSVSRIAHALKGSAANMGARRVAGLAQILEKAPEAVSDACLQALERALGEATGALRKRMALP